MTYRDAGVDIEQAQSFVKKVKQAAQATTRPEVMSAVGGFAALCEIPKHIKQPVLVSSTDGVGTKLKIAAQLNQHQFIGQDLVAMCVNDILTYGAEPLYFLDYLATNKLNQQQLLDVIQGIVHACQQTNTALVGGETAEMPGVYQKNEYDLAGFCVGVIEKSQIIDTSKVSVGDKIIGLASSGLHSNGFSLVRYLLQQHNISFDTPLGGSTLGEVLLTPTTLYVNSILSLLVKHNVHAMAHITGGGLIENLPRVLPPFTVARLDPDTWPQLDIFSYLKKLGNLQPSDMYSTFNMGIGYCCVVSKYDAMDILYELQQSGQKAYNIGEIQPSSKSKATVIIESLNH